MLANTTYFVHHYPLIVIKNTTKQRECHAMTFVQRISRRTFSRRASSQPRSLAGVYASACRASWTRGEPRSFLVRALPAKNEPLGKMSRFPLYRNCASFVSSCLCNIGLTLSLLLRPSGRRFDSQVAQNEAMNVANAVR